MDMGDKLRALRREKKLTQEQLAEYLHISSQAVSKWETGASCPDLDMVLRLAAFYQVSTDELLDFDRRRIDAEVDALITESVPLRKDPAEAEAFYREALRRYPNNEVLLNCLLMVIPNQRVREKLEIGEKLLDCSRDDEIRLDVLRLLALSCRAAGEKALAEQYLARLPELYFLKTEVAAFLKDGEARLAEIRKTEEVCAEILAAMLALRAKDGPGGRERCAALLRELLAVYRQLPEHASHADELQRLFDSDELLDCFL